MKKKYIILICMGCVKFVKKFSKIPEYFIDDFVNVIYNFKYSNNVDEKKNEFVVDIMLLCKWFKINKSDLKKNITNNFFQNKNYIVFKNPNKIGRGGKNIYNH